MPPKVRVSYTAGAGFVVNWPALCARDQGFYTDEGLDVELIPLSQDMQTTSLVTGRVPIERRGPDEDIVAIDRGASIAIVAGLARRPPIWLYALPEFTSLKDLRGKKIGGISSKYGSSLALRMLFDDELIGPDEYTVAPVGGTLQRFEALKNGEIAATLLSPPTSAQAAALGLVLLADVPARYPDFLYSAMQVNRLYASQFGDVLIKLLRADLRGQRWIYDPANRAAAIRSLRIADRMSPEDAETCYVEMVEKHRIYCEDGEIGPDSLVDLIDGLTRLGDLPAGRSAERYLDLSFLEAARASL